MPEWSIGAVSKTVVPLREPRVRIPVLPQKIRMKPAAGQRVSFVLHLHPPAPGRGTGQQIQWPSGSYLPPVFLIDQPKKALPEQSFLMFVSIEVRGFRGGRSRNP